MQRWRRWHGTDYPVSNLIMRFSTEVRDNEFPALIADLHGITGVEPWTRRFEWLQHELGANSYMESWLRERCAIEMTLYKVLYAHPDLAHRAYRLESIQHFELIAFMASVTRCYQKLNGAGRNRLRGMLVDGLKTDKGLLAVQQEMATAVHLMRRGFDVEFFDLENGGGVDFIARRDDIEIEVECKVFSGDLGRKIHKRKCVNLYKALEEVVVRTYKAATRGLIIRITIPGRLTAALDQHQGIAQDVGIGILSGDTVTRSPRCEVEVRDFEIGNSPFCVSKPHDLSISAIGEFVKGEIGRSNSNLMNLFSPGKRAVVALVESSEPDDVLGGIRRQLRDAAIDQFSKSRPGYLVAQLHDLTAEQLLDIAESDSSWRGNASRLQVMTSDLLDNSSRSHVHTIVYLYHSTIDTSAKSGEAIIADGTAYTFANANHPNYKDSRFGVFRDINRLDSPRIIQMAS